MFQVRVTGLDRLRQQLDGFSDRRFAAAVATALTRAAGSVATGWRGDIRADLDRPTPFIQNRSVRVQRADAQNLVATVRINDDAQGGGLTPAQILAPHVFGGDRVPKRFELALQAQGAMPRGMRAVPGAGAKLDQYGNVSRQQIVQVLNQLGTELSPGYQRVISQSAARRIAAARRAGREFIALPNGSGRLSPGIYARAGRGLVAVFLFVRGTTYSKRLDLMASAQRIARERLPAELQRAFREHAARLAAKGRAA